MQTSVKIKFCPSTIKGKPGSLYIQFIKNRKARKVVIKGIKIYPNEWDEVSESFRVNIADTQRKIYLEGAHVKMIHGKVQLQEAIKHLELRNPYYTVDDVLETYWRRRCSNNLTAYAERLAENRDANQPRTARTYRSVARRVKEYNKGDDISLNSITPVFIKGFESYLLAKGNKPNTTSYYCRGLRAIMNQAVEDKILEIPQERLFAGVFTGNDKTEKRAVKKDVIETLETLDFSEKKNKHMEMACQLFLLSYYLRGISFIDLAYLKKNNISDGCIRYTRRKTGQRFEVEITPEIQVILNRYWSEDSDYLFPVLRDGDSRTEYENALRRENAYLKQLSTLIGLDKPLTTYTARHSWASNAYAMGFPIELVSQGLGHENVRTTMIYLKTFDYSSLHEANRKIINGGKDAA